MSESIVRRLRLIARHPATWLVLLALVPLVSALVRATAHGWSPEGDDAIIADRISSVFSSHPPVMGQRSTSILSPTASVPTHHPGPLEYYLAAPVVALFGGGSFGVLVAVFGSNAASVIGTVLIAHRLRGARASVPATAGVLLLEWVLGPEVLARPLNTYVAALPLLLMLVAAWALLDGYLAVLWVYVVAASYVAQANLAFVPFVLGVTVALLAVAATQHVLHRGFHAVNRRSWRHAYLIAGVSLLVVWLPSLIELRAYSPDNLQQVLAYQRQAGAGRSWLDALGYPVSQLSPFGLRRFESNQPFSHGTGAVIAGSAVIAVLLAGAFAGGRAHTAGSRACALTVAAVAAETWGLTHMPPIAVNYWLVPTFATAAFALTALLLRGTELVRQRSALHRAQRGSRRLTVACGAVGLGLAALATATARPADWTTMERSRHLSATLATYISTHVLSGSGVALTDATQDALSLQSAIGYRLDGAGYHCYYMLPWKVPEDTDRWHVDHAPPAGIVRVTVAERRQDGSWSTPRPEGSEAVILGGSTKTRVVAWVSVPTENRMHTANR